VEGAYRGILMDSPSNAQGNNMTISLAKRAALYIGILAFAFVLLLFLGAGQASAEDVSGDIVGDDVVWASDGVYNVTGDVNIIGNLTIEDNVTVVFEDYYNFNVFGSLVVEGTAAHPVIFSWNESAMNYWGYMWFWSGSSGSLDYLNISRCDGIYLDNVSVPVTNINVTDVTYGIYAQFYEIEHDMVVEGALFENIYYDAIYVEADVLVSFEITNSTFTNVGTDYWNDYCIQLSSSQGDMDFVMGNVTMMNCNAGFYAIANNGSISATLNDVHMDDIPYWVGGWYAFSYDDSARVDFSITDSSFNNTDYGIWFYSEAAGSIEVIRTSFTNIYGDGALTQSDTSVGDMSIVLEDVLMDNVVVGIDPAVIGNITLTMENVVINDTNELGWFVASNVDNTAFIDVMINNCAFSNATYGFYFEADAAGVFEVTNTVFSSIDYYVFEMVLDHGDVMMQIDGVEAMDIGSYLDLTVTFGNIELVITDSILHGNYALGIFLIDATVNSDTVDNGFVTLTVVNSVFKNASGGIRTWSEELNPIDLTTTLFENITGEAMHFDVRSGDLDFTFAGDDLTVVNSGTGLWAYANDGDINLNLNGSYINTNEFGVLLEVSSWPADDLSVINLNVLDSVFEGGAYGIYALSQNGGVAWIEGSQFIGQHLVGFYYDSVYGEVNATLTDNVFDGSSANDVNSYFVEQIDYEFELYGRSSTEWIETFDDSVSHWVDLPFLFEYDGVMQSEVQFSPDGGLRFGSHSSIRAVGNNEMSYSSGDDHFFGYMIGENNSYILFNWYAYYDWTGTGLSNAFQVILFPNGDIQFNYAAMEGYSNNIDYGLLLNTGSDLHMQDLFGDGAWNLDFTSILLTPFTLSDGMAANVVCDEGDVNAIITNNTVASYWNGGIVIQSLNGGLDLEVTGNDFTMIYGDDYSALYIYGYNGASELVMADNTFNNIWGLGVYLYLMSNVGGEKVIDVSDSVFDNVAYAFYSTIGVVDDNDRTGTDSLDVTVNFVNNMMTDSYGLVCRIELNVYDPVDWTVNVTQTMTGNVMKIEDYTGSWPFAFAGWDGPALGSDISIYSYNEGGNVELIQTANVTGNHIEYPGSYDGIVVGNYIENYWGDTSRAATIDVSDNLVNCTGDNGVNVFSELYVGSGVVADDVSIIIENNQIYDGTYDITGILVVLCVDADQLNMEEDVDADVVHYVSVANNVMEAVDVGVNSVIWYYQVDTIGNWSVSLTNHIDNNEFLGVDYTAVAAFMWSGAWYGDNYWPLYDEVAVSNFVMDYQYTVDNNMVETSSDRTSEMISVDMRYRSLVDISSLFAEAHAWYTGALSISGNEMTSMEGYLRGIELDQSFYALKTCTMDVDIDVAVDNNIISVIWEDGPGSNPRYGINIDNEIDSWSNDNVATAGPMMNVDLTYSVTGNEISNGFRNGIEVLDDIQVYNAGASLVYDVSWDISGNSVTDVREYGISYELSDRADEVGTYDLNIAVDIVDNIVSLMDDPDNSAGIYLDSRYNVESWVYWDDLIGNRNFVASVSGNTVTGAETGLEIYGALYFAVPEDYVTAEDEVLFTFVNDIMVENNYIVGSSDYGMYLEDGMTVRNNIVEGDIGVPEVFGIYWYEAEGEMVGNTITAEIGVYVDYLHNWLVQNNLIQFGATGMDIYTYDYEEMTDGVIIDNTITALENPFLPWSSYGINIDETGNILISGNVISGADYGVYMDDAWNVTVEGNEISNCENSGVYVYYASWVWIESNTMTSCDEGVFVDEYVEDIVIGNNSFFLNYYGIYLDDEVHRMVLWNNMFIDNEYAVDIDTLYLEAIWYVDAQCQSSRSDIDFNGPIYVLEGGSMVLEDMELDVYGGLTVEEGGLLSISDVYVNECEFIDVAGTFWASLSVFEETDICLMPTAEAEIRTSTFYYSEMVIDGCSPVVADNLFVGYGGEYGMTILNGASPSIVSNIIALYAVGIYANGMDMGGVYDNLIVGNYMAGLLAENCTGAIHDNVFLVNKVEILLRNSDVSVEDNEIGYTNLFQIIANYAPILGHFVSLGGDSNDSETSTVADPQAAMDAILSSSWSDIGSWVKAHNGIWAEGSVVQTSGNVYGLLNYALYAVDSEIHFADDVRTIVLTVPHVNDGEMYNYSLNIYTLNGLYAARSQVWVDGSTIEVIDDALVLESSDAWVEGATLLAGDFDYFVFGGSEVYNIATNYSKAKVMDSHSLNEGTWLTLTAMDKGDPAANVSVVIKNAKGEIVYTGITDADGKVKVLLTQYSYTSEGKDDGFNPYTITADFESGEKSVDVTLDQSYQDLTIEGEEESDMGAILAVVGVLVIILLIVAAVVVMRRRK